MRGLRRSALKGRFGPVETEVVKACPHCDAQLRDSVIRCTRCLRPLNREPAEDVPPSTPRPAPVRSATSQTGAWGGTGRASTRSAEVWASPPAWAPSAARPPVAGDLPDFAGRRALPAGRVRTGRFDAVMLLAAAAAAASGYLAWKAVGDPWVTLDITDTADLEAVPIGRVALEGRRALVGAIALGLAGALGALGVAWLVYGFDRRSTMPWLVHPAIAIVTTVGGLGAAVLASTLWFVWKDAAVAGSPSVAMGAGELRELLESQPPPYVEIERMAGANRYGTMMLLGLLAASAALWACRRRG